MVPLLLIVAVVFAYLFTAGVVWKNFYPWRVKSCIDCSGGNSYRCDLDHTASSFFASALWPLALPVCLAIYGGAILGMGHGGMTRAERRRAEEIAEAKHKQSLAKIQADTTKELERGAF